MLRHLHKFPALVAGVLVSFLAVTGTILAFQPLTEQLTTPATEAEASDVATLAAGIAENFEGASRLVKTASGKYILYQQTTEGVAANLVDPATGQDLGTYAPSVIYEFITELHRSLLLGDDGRLAALLGAAAMLILTVSGLFLLARRMGGWHQLLASPKGTFSQKLHVELSRFGILGFSILSVTGLWLAMSYFGWVGADATADFFSFPLSSDGTPLAVDQLAALQNTSLTDLRELVFPAAGDATDVFTLTTAAGSGYVDQVTGDWVNFTANTFWQDVYQFAYTLHTGEGIWWYALLLGAAAALVPALAATGTVVWWKRRSAGARIRGNAPAQKADTIILVGSEGQTTWGFAHHLFEQLKTAGHTVHIAPMNALARRYGAANSVLVLTATYGDGDSPASASNFMDRIQRFEPLPGQSFAVLGFGDRSFPAFCAFAHETGLALEQAGLTPLLELGEIDRQSTQQFAQWGRDLGTALGIDLELNHKTETPATDSWVLENKSDFGQEFQTPKSILRFRFEPAETGHRFGGLFAHRPRYQAGDLIGILPPANPDGTVPTARYYSLASGHADGYLEICVSKQPAGLCSTYLCELQPGARIEGFIKANRDFRPPSSKPVIMIGAGTGVAPFVGMARANARRKPAYLYFGARNPQSDFVFGKELQAFHEDGRLSGLNLAFSRSEQKAYVQDRLRDDAAFLRQMIGDGAHIMVCGSLAMARGVTEAIDEILEPLGLNAAALRHKGRYLEDVY